MNYSRILPLLLILNFKVLIASSQTVTVKAIPLPCILLNRPETFQVLSDNSILMTAGKGTDLHHSASGRYSRSNAPMFLFTPDSNFLFSARVKAEINNLYDGGALLIWSDAGNWAKILIQNTGEKSIIGMSVVKDKVTDDSYFNISPAREIFLKLTKTGKVFNFYVSDSGTDWTLVRQFVYHKPEDFKIGFYSQSPKGSSCKVEYSGIIYTTLQ